MKRFTLLIVLSAISTTSLVGADCIDFTQYAHWLADAPFTGIAGGVDVDKGHAYVVNQSSQGGGLTIYDIRNPLEPIAQGSTPSSGAKYDVVAEGGYAYVTSNDGFEVVDVQNPEIPIVRGSITTPDLACGLDVRGDLAYVAAEDSGLVIIDVSSPAAPVQIGHLSLPGRTRDVVVVGDWAYVANYDQLGVIDITDPEQPHLEGAAPLPGGYANSLAADGTYAYVGGLSSGDGLHVFDVANPAAPVRTGSLGGFTAYDVELAGTIPVVASSRGLTLVDPADPAAPTLLTHVPVTGDFVAASQNFAYLGGGTVVQPDLRVIDLGNFASPSPLGAYVGLDHAFLVDTAGDTAFLLGTIGTNDVRFEAIDLSDPHAPAYVASVDLGHHTQFRTLEVTGGLAAFSLEETVHLVDVASPQNMQLEGSAEAGFGIQEVAIQTPYLYVATLLGLKIFDVAEPAAPLELGTFETSNLAGVAVSGSLAYLCGDGFGLQILDVSDPSVPLGRGDLSGYHHYTTIAVAWPYAYVAGPSGFAVVDVTSPDAPFVAAELPLPGEAVDLDVCGSVVAVAMLGSQVELYDISDPAAPAILGNTAGGPPSYAWSVEATSVLILVGADTGGLQLFPAHCQPSAVGELDDGVRHPSRQGAPAPKLAIHPSVGMAPRTLSFSLPALGSVELRILDVTGRTVRLLHSGPLASGSHTRTWDGRDQGGRSLESGVYFGQIEAPGGVTAERMVVTR